MENLELRVSSGIAKTTGTILSITGALTMTLYEGSPVAFASSTSTKLKGNGLSPQTSWILGGLFSATAALSLATAFVVQVYKNE